MTVPARDAILGRLRSARPTSRLPRADAAGPAKIARHSNDDCLKRFEVEARGLGVDVWVELSPADVRARVASVTMGLRVLSWDVEHLPYDVGVLMARAVAGSAPRDEQALADIGVTGCDAAIAETGSLAMITGPGRSRIVSLLPPSHLAIVRRAQLCGTMAEFFSDRGAQLAEASSCTFITGPSRTADIELTLTLGIHGPGRVAIVIGP